MLHRLSIIRRLLPERRTSSEALTDQPYPQAQRQHALMVALDIAGFGLCDPYLQPALRAALYRIVQETCTSYGIRWAQTYSEDRGDGLFFLLDTRMMLHLEDLAISIAIALRKHNRGAEPAQRFAVRMSMHVGFLQRDGHGITGPDIILLHRLLEAPALKRHLADHPHAGFALIISDALQHVAAPSRMIVGRDYRRVSVQVKETTTHAWILRPEAPTCTGSPDR